MALEEIKKKIVRILERSYSIQSANTAASMCNYESFASLKNRYCGREVALCGAGPTLKQYEPIDGAVHIALNRALLYDKVKFDMFVADDWEGINFFQKELIEYDCEKFLGYHFGNQNFREIPESFRIASKAKKYYTDSYLHPNQDQSKLIVDIDKMAISNQFNMGLSAMQIALFTNPKVIYLVGMDSNSNGHFTNKGLDDEKAKNIDRNLKKYVDYNSIKEKWEDVKEFATVYYPDTEIVSINPVGLKGLFTDYFQKNLEEQ